MAQTDKIPGVADPLKPMLSSDRNFYDYAKRVTDAQYHAAHAERQRELDEAREKGHLLADKYKHETKANDDWLQAQKTSHLKEEICKLPLRRSTWQNSCLNGVWNTRRVNGRHEKLNDKLGMISAPNIKRSTQRITGAGSIGTH